MDTITSLIDTSCRHSGVSPAFFHKYDEQWRETSYDSLRVTSDRVAAGLVANGFLPGYHAALLASSSPHWVMAYLGIMKAGGVVVPIDKELKEIEMCHILSHSEARAVFVDEDHLELMHGLSNVLTDLYLIVAFPQAGETIFPTTRFSCCLLRSFNDLLGAEECSPVVLRSEDPALILYTSGTTGRAKGAVISHANIVSNIRGAVAHLEVDHTVHTLSFLPINHVFEQVCGILLPLSLGGKVSFCESLKKLGENLAEVKPTFFVGVPAVYRIILDRIMKKIEERAISRLLFSCRATRPLVTARVREKIGSGTIFISGGAALDPAISEGFARLGVTLYQGYGITETSPVIATESRNGKRLGTVGRVLAGVEVRIDAPDDELVGEILVKGPNVMQGYFKDPHATREAIVDGWYHTGDLGRLDSEGFLSVCGRVKSLIVTANGKNVYPEEVETEILKSPFITEVVVYAHRNPAGEEEIAAVVRPYWEALEEYVSSQEREPLPNDEVYSLLRREVLASCKKLAAYKRVRLVSICNEEFPKTTTRKIKRFEMERLMATPQGEHLIC